MTTQEEIKAFTLDLRRAAEPLFHFRTDGSALRSTLNAAADLIERLAAERAAGEFWRGVFDEITDKTDREKIEAELSDYHFMMEQVPTVYMHITGGKMSKCNYYDHAVIAEADEYQNKLIDEAVQEALERSKDDESTSVSAHIKPLVWIEEFATADGEHRSIAHTPLGTYCVYQRRSGGRCFWQIAYSEPELCDDIEDGKAKAWAHWVERISPMLTEGHPIPEGWKLVPIEPTEKMIEDGHATIPGILDVCLADVEDAWTAMLNASPSPGGDQK